jgi:uncharacterized protein YecT (DUF1311 family)
MPGKSSLASKADVCTVSAMRILILLMAMVLPLTAPRALMADEALEKLDAEMEKKAEEAGGASSGSARVYADYADLWDKEMNRLYKQMMAELPEAQKNALRESQRAWLKYRDAQWAWIESAYTADALPTMYMSFRAYAHMDVVRQRALDLAQRWEGYQEFRESL